MIKVLFLVLKILSGLFWIGIARADQVAISGNQFSLISPGARESAMGGEFSAFADGAFGVFGNPAATASLKGGDISLSQLFWFTNTNDETTAFTQSFRGFGTLGLGFSLYWVPAFDNTGGVENAFSSTSYEGVMSYSTPLDFLSVQGLAFGASARYIADTFGTLAQTSDAALDLGLYYQTPFKPLRLGLSFKNIDLAPSTINSVPFSYGFGFAMGDGPGLLTGEIMETAGQDTQYQTGEELWLEKFLALRAGFRSQITSGSYFGPSAGVGLKLGPGLSFDYAAASYGDLGLVNWISLNISWDPPKPTPVPTPPPAAIPVTVVEVMEAPTPKIIYMVKVVTPSATTTPSATPKGPRHHFKPGFSLHGSVANGNTVQLNWNAPVSVAAPVVGYNVYTSIVQGAGFKKVNDQPITVTHWSEQAGLHGITFYYQIKAVDAQSAEISASEVRSVNVP